MLFENVYLTVSIAFASIDTVVTALAHARLIAHGLHYRTLWCNDQIDFNYMYINITF